MNKMTRGRRRIGFTALLLLIALVAYSLSTKEPTYQGRSLSSWLEELAALQHEVEAGEPVATEQEKRRREATTAVRTIGSRALPWLLRWLQDSRESKLRARLQQLLDKQSLVDIDLPERRDRYGLAVIGFQTLGSSAAPALPKLGKLVLDPALGPQACMCLHAIGPTAWPAFVPALTSSNNAAQQGALWFLAEYGTQVGAPVVLPLLNAATNPASQNQRLALIVLGNLGPLSREFRPWVESIMRDSQGPLVGPAMRVMVELSDHPEQYVEFLGQRLSSTNLVADAAFALGAIGPEGVRPLLRALADPNPAVQHAAYAAIAQRHFGSAAKRPPPLPFISASHAFDLQYGRWNLRANSPAQPLSTALRLADVLVQCEDPEVRIEITRLLQRYGHNAALGLSLALVDNDPAVREAAREVVANLNIELDHGAVVRGSKDRKQIALVFTGHEFAEGGETILKELARHGAEASFFLTGSFLSNGNFTSFVEQVVSAGHYIGPHSDRHLLYCSWDQTRRTLVTETEFSSDLTQNLSKVPLGMRLMCFVPPYEHCNLEVVRWAGRMSCLVINLTPGTRTAADYTSESDTNFASSQTIFDSVLAQEKQDSNGLNGFILLFHTGSGPRRADKFHTRLGELLDRLTEKGYKFVAVDELFNPEAARKRREHLDQSRPDSPAMKAFRRRYGLSQ